MHRNVVAGRNDKYQVFYDFGLLYRYFQKYWNKECKFNGGYYLSILQLLGKILYNSNLINISKSTSQKPKNVWRDGKWRDGNISSVFRTLNVWGLFYQFLSHHAKNLLKCVYFDEKLSNHFHFWEILIISCDLSNNG